MTLQAQYWEVITGPTKTRPRKEGHLSCLLLDKSARTAKKGHVNMLRSVPGVTPHSKK